MISLKQAASKKSYNSWRSKTSKRFYNYLFMNFIFTKYDSLVNSASTKQLLCHNQTKGKTFGHVKVIPFCAAKWCKLTRQGGVN